MSIATYREYIQNLEKRAELHKILERLKSKGYLLPEPAYKRYPRGFDKNEPDAYLALYRSIYAYSSFSPDEVFYSDSIVDKNFKIYEDMIELQQWIYELTLCSIVKTS